MIYKVFNFALRNLSKILWKDGRAVDGTGLENRHTEMYPGFKSLSFRQLSGCSLVWLKAPGLGPGDRTFESYHPDHRNIIPRPFNEQIFIFYKEVFKMTMVKVNCAYCSKEHEIELKRHNLKVKRNENFYCSKECEMLTKKQGAIVECAYCGKEIYRSKSAIERSKSGNLFCSRSCAVSFNNTLYKTGEDHPQYNGGISSYRQRAFDAYPHKCAICGWNKDSRILEVHHINESHDDNSLENLIILCPTCHKHITLQLYELKNRKILLEKKKQITIE